MTSCPHKNRSETQASVIPFGLREGSIRFGANAYPTDVTLAVGAG